MTKKKSLWKKLTEKKCFSCSKALPANKTGTHHWVQTADGTWKRSCLGCKTSYGGRTVKPLFKNNQRWGH